MPNERTQAYVDEDVVRIFVSICKLGKFERAAPKAVFVLGVFVLYFHLHLHKSTKLPLFIYLTLYTNINTGRDAYYPHKPSQAKTSSYFLYSIL